VIPLLLAVQLSAAAPWLGASGKVRTVFAPQGAAARAAIIEIDPHYRKVKHAAAHPGAYVLRDGVTFYTLVPFAKKNAKGIGHYRMGQWPQETGGSANDYVAPEGFMRVTAADTSRKLSQRFELGWFLTHDQKDVWPKYALVRPELLDKLELLGDALAKAGKSDRMVVMSGFRTPQYNAPGVGAGGRVEDSRHLYGDAADVYVDADGDSLMDDLDGDGQTTVEDARWLSGLVEQIENAHAELVGGIGVYPAAEDHGPFVHVDVRGKRARW
jgi:hypothetical protein